MTIWTLVDLVFCRYAICQDVPIAGFVHFISPTSFGSPIILFTSFLRFINFSASVYQGNLISYSAPQRVISSFLWTDFEGVDGEPVSSDKSKPSSARQRQTQNRHSLGVLHLGHSVFVSLWLIASSLTSSELFIAASTFSQRTHSIAWPASKNNVFAFSQPSSQFEWASRCSQPKFLDTYMLEVDHSTSPYLHWCYLHFSIAPLLRQACPPRSHRASHNTVAGNPQPPRCVLVLLLQSSPFFGPTAPAHSALELDRYKCHHCICPPSTLVSSSSS